METQLQPVVVVVESHQQAHDFYYSAIFLYFHSNQTSSRDHPASYQWVLGSLSPGVEQPQSDLQGGRVFLEEMSCRRYDKECEEQKERHIYKIGTWNVRTLNQGGKLENLKTEMQKNDVSVLGVSEVRWKGQGEIRSGDYTVYYS